MSKKCENVPSRQVRDLSVELRDETIRAVPLPSEGISHVDSGLLLVLGTVQSCFQSR